MKEGNRFAKRAIGVHWIALMLRMMKLTIEWNQYLPDVDIQASLSRVTSSSKLLVFEYCLRDQVSNSIDTYCATVQKQQIPTTQDRDLDKVSG
ncbi:hypothetical protein Tco_1234527 [Tanacetum coccineum]